MNTIAMPVVSRVRKFPAPLLPKIVALDPPNTAPISAPLPVCKSTTRISPKLTMIWTMVIKKVIPRNPQFALAQSAQGNRLDKLTNDPEKIARLETCTSDQQAVDL